MPVIDSVSELTPEKALIFRVTHVDNTDIAPTFFGVVRISSAATMIRPHA